jgi:hypothetical protein
MFPPATCSGRMDDRFTLEQALADSLAFIDSAHHDGQGAGVITNCNLACMLVGVPRTGN